MKIEDFQRFGNFVSKTFKYKTNFYFITWAYSSAWFRALFPEFFWKRKSYMKFLESK